MSFLRMAITDLFSSSFLFSVAIIIILIGGIFAFISYRMAEQDHKLNAMLGLVTTMANETQFFRSKIHTIQQQLDKSNDLDTHHIHLTPNDLGFNGGFNIVEKPKNLINVSDDEDDEDDNDEDEDDEDDEDDDEDEDEEDEDDEDQDDEDEDEDENENEDNENENEDNEDDDHNNINTNNETIKIITLIDGVIPNSQLENIGDLKHIHLDSQEDNVALISNNLIEELNVTGDNNNFLSNISINDLGDIDDLQSLKNDYKKLSLNKLREVVVSKGLITDASKLKKNEILKLLGEE